jgi:hypothetical protein
MTEHHVPLVSLTYETAALALSLMAKVIEGAVVANATTGRVSSASGDDAPSPREAHKAVLRPCRPPNIRRPATSLQRRLSGDGGVEMDAEGFIHPGYSAAVGPPRRCVAEISRIGQPTRHASRA